MVKNIKAQNPMIATKKRDINEILKKYPNENALSGKKIIELDALCKKINAKLKSGSVSPTKLYCGYTIMKGGVMGSFVKGGVNQKCMIDELEKSVSSPIATKATVKTLKEVYEMISR